LEKRSPVQQRFGGLQGQAGTPFGMMAIFKNKAARRCHRTAGRNVIVGATKLTGLEHQS
jgi:hypothetical protein